MPYEAELPPPKTLAEFHERLRCIAALHQMSVTSGGRTEQRNRKVGGVSNSWHRWRRGGMAADMYPDDAERIDIGERIANAAVDAQVLGFDAIVHETYLHLEPAGE